MTKESFALIISGLAIIVSGFTMYLTEYAEPDISVIAGPRIDVYYPKKRGAGFYVPLTFINSSSKQGVLLRIAMSVAKSENFQ